MSAAIKVSDLIFSGPDCPNCDIEVSCDGSSWWCDGCGSSWDIDGTNGEHPGSDA